MWGVGSVLKTAKNLTSNLTNVLLEPEGDADANYVRPLAVCVVRAHTFRSSKDCC